MVEPFEIVSVWPPSVTLLLATPLRVVIVAPVVPEMSNVPAALATLTWLEAAMLPVPPPPER